MSVVDRNGALDALIEGREGLCAYYARDFLYASVQEFHQVVGVVGVKFDKDGICAKCELGFNYLGDLFKLGYYAVVERTLLEGYAYIYAHIESEFLRVDVESGTFDDTEFGHPLHSLVD